jgi:hypothetical protein
VGFLGGRYKAGQYTYKIHRAESRLPRMLAPLIDSAKLDFHEESFNCHPFVKTVVSCPALLGENFYIEMDTLCVPGVQDLDNPLGKFLKFFLIKRVLFSLKPWPSRTVSSQLGSVALNTVQ